MLDAILYQYCSIVGIGGTPLYETLDIKIRCGYSGSGYLVSTVDINGAVLLGLVDSTRPEQPQKRSDGDMLQSKQDTIHFTPSHFSLFLFSSFLFPFGLSLLLCYPFSLSILGQVLQHLKEG